MSRAVGAALPAGMQPERLELWRRAESTLGRSRAADRAAEHLPPRLACLHRAMAALEDGRVAEARRVAEEASRAGQGDIAEVLRLLCEAPEEIDPTELRKRAKKAGLGGGVGFPFLDLLRSLAVVLAGDRSPAAAALRKATPGRPTLDCAVKVLTTADERPVQQWLLRAWSPRAEQVQAVAHALLFDQPVRERWLQVNFGTPLLTIATDGGGADRAELLRRRIAQGSWPETHDADAEWLYTRPLIDQRGWLALLLQRLARDVRAGKLHGLADFAHIAHHLVSDRSADRRGEPLLARQLKALELRLGWVEDPEELPLALILALWKERAAGLPAEARIELAQRFADRLEEVDEEEAALALEVMALLIARTDRWTEVVAMLNGVSESFGHVLHPGQVAQAITAAGATPARQRFVAALLAVDVGDLPACLRAIESLAALPGGVEAACLAAHHLVDAHLRDVPVRLSERRAVGKTLSALIAAKPPLAHLRGVLGLVAYADPLPPELGALVLSRVQESGSTTPERAFAIHALLLVGQVEAATARVREVGRELRKMPADEADDLALGLISAVYDAARPRPDSPLHAVMEPLLRFLVREGPGRAEAAAGRFRPRWSDDLGLVAFYLQHHMTLGRSDLWLDLLVRKLGPEDGIIHPEMQQMFNSFLKGMIQSFIGARPVTVEELMEHISRMSSNMSASIPGPLLGRGDLPF